MNFNKNGFDFSPGTVSGSSIPEYKSALYLTALIILTSFMITCCAGTMPSKSKRAQIQEDMGSSLALDGKPRKGLVYLLKAEKINPSDPELQHKLALIYEEIGEYDLSLNHFQKAIRLKPEYPEAYNNMGILYSKKKEWDKALDCFEKAAADVLYSTPEFAYHNIGSVYFHTGDYPKAIENYEKAIKIAPNYIAVYQDLAALYESTGQQNKALATYKAAIAIAPQAWDIHLSLSRLYLKMGLRQEAIKELNLIISTNPRGQFAKDASKILDSIELKE